MKLVSIDLEHGILRRYAAAGKTKAFEAQIRLEPWDRTADLDPAKIEEFRTETLGHGSAAA